MDELLPLVPPVEEPMAEELAGELGTPEKELEGPVGPEPVGEPVGEPEEEPEEPEREPEPEPESELELGLEEGLERGAEVGEVLERESDGGELGLEVVPELVGVELEPVVAAEVPLAVGAVLEGRTVTSLQEISNRVSLLSVLPTIPKLGFGVTGAASWRVNQYMSIFPKLGHPTASQ